MERKRYGYAESSALAATYGDAHIYSVMDDENILENGMLVELVDLVTNEIYTIKSPEAGSKVVLILDPAVSYDQSTTYGQSEVFYYVKEGVPARAYNLIENDRYAIIDYLVTSLAGEGKPVVVGNYVVVDPATRKYTEVANGEDLSTYGFVAKIAAIEYKSGMTLYRLRVIKNQAVA